MSNSADVAKLRAETGAGVMDCKKALDETSGDFEKAKKVLAKNADAIAQKKADRATNNGIIVVYSHLGKVGVVLEINSETDFVAKNPEFKELAHDLAMQIASMNPKDIEELKEQPFIKDESIKIEDLVKSKIAKTGENIQIKRFQRFELGES